MTAVLLCPGPSLAKVLQRTAYGSDLLIGVNRAATGFELDWWCFGDASTYENNWYIGNPNVCTSAVAVQRLRDEEASKPFNPPELLTFCELAERIPNDIGWVVFSATSALVLAAYLGAKQIEVYGADWTVDGADFDGRMPDGAIRGAERWTSEANVWRDTVTKLETLGVTTTKVTV